MPTPTQVPINIDGGAIARSIVESTNQWLLILGLDPHSLVRGLLILLGGTALGIALFISGSIFANHFRGRNHS